MNEDDKIIHDTSRIDAFMAARRKSMVLHALWRPMLAGAVGAAIIVGAVWAASPRLHINEIEVPRITYREVTVPNIIEKSVTVDVPHVVTKDVEVPRIILKDTLMPGPQASAGGSSNGSGAAGGGGTGRASTPPIADLPKSPIADPEMGPQSPYAAKTPEENKFVDQPEYKTASIHGRIVKSRNGTGLWFEDGSNFDAAHWDAVSKTSVKDPAFGVDSDPFVGDLGMCVEEKGRKDLYDCYAFHNGQQVEIPNQRMDVTSAAPQQWHDYQIDPPSIPASQPTGTWKDPNGKGPVTDATSPCPTASENGLPILVCGKPTTPAESMVEVVVDVDGYPVNAMVDTGCSWPMSIPSALADLLVKQHRAETAPFAKSTLADGTLQNTAVVVIDYITVDGRHLRNVTAAIAPNGAPILLGLGSLNRLGPYTIADGKVVFTGSQPS